MSGQQCDCRTPDPQEPPRPSDCPRQKLRDLYPEVGMAAYIANKVIAPPNPDYLLVKRGEVHDPHELAGPGGNKPGARCRGIAAPEDDD